MRVRVGLRVGVGVRGGVGVGVRSGVGVGVRSGVGVGVRVRVRTEDTHMKRRAGTKRAGVAASGLSTYG